MAVLPTFADFRERFARRIEVTQSVNLADGPLTNIVRNAIDWDTTGIAVGMAAVITGSASNDHILLRVVSFDDETLVVDQDLTGETAVTVTITFWEVDPDGQPAFPGVYSLVNLVRANSFDGGIAISFADGIQAEISVNAGAADSVAGVDEYDWYLSQRTDTAASQFFTLTQKADIGGDSFSGTVLFEYAPIATQVYGVTGNTITVEAFFRLLTHVHLYCRRKSDGAIQWTALLDAMMPS
jgi:hypothetical protein